MIILVSSFSCSIGAYSLLYAYYFYSSFRYIRSPSENVLFYKNTLTTFVPIVIYLHTLIQLYINTLSIEQYIFDYFFMEWMITTPLLISTIAFLAKLKMYKQFVLVASTILMNLFGMLANKTISSQMLFLYFGIGCSIFIFIMIYVILLYKNRVNSIFKSNEPYIQYTNFLKCLIQTVLVTWIFYPGVFLMYKLNVIPIEYSIILFNLLDFISKGVFIGNIIRYNEVIALRDTFISQIYPQPISTVSTDTLHLEVV